jgi:hypothetical protein
MAHCADQGHTTLATMVMGVLSAMELTTKNLEVLGIGKYRHNCCGGGWAKESKKAAFLMDSMIIDERRGTLTHHDQRLALYPRSD